jgi:hypothetical protein
VQQTTSIVSTTVRTTTAVRSTTVAAPAPVDQCSNIAGLQTKVPRGLVKRSGKCVATLTLSASALVKRPLQPIAGQQFAVGATILNAKTKTKLPSAVVTCPAVVAGKPLAPRRKFFDTPHSAAYCYWMIPASARGTFLQGAVVATYQGAYVRRWVRLRVE